MRLVAPLLILAAALVALLVTPERSSLLGLDHQVFAAAAMLVALLVFVLTWARPGDVGRAAGAAAIWAALLIATKFAAWLETASRAEIEDFAREFRRAKAYVVADSAKGIEVDGAIFSEDATEDFYDWIVAQGRPFWQAAVASRTDLSGLAREYRRKAANWNAAALGQKYSGSHAPRLLAYAIYDARFGADLDDA